MTSRTLLSDIIVPDRNSFGALRLAAALVVAITHAIEIVTGHLNWDMAYAATGYTLGQHAVHVFFILSGFLVTASLDRTADVVAFTRARALRIFPGLMACIVFTVAVMGPLISACTISGYFSDAGLVKYTLKTVFLVTGRGELPGVFATNPLPGQINNSIWTLKYEVLCYAGLALAFIGGLLASRRKALATLVALCVVVLATYVVPGLIEYKSTLDTVRRFALCFALGSVAYYLRNHIRLSFSMLLASAALVAVLWGTSLKVPVLLVSETYFVFVLASLRRNALARFTARHDLSYGIYLYGWPVSQSLLQMNPDLSAAWVVVLTVCTLIPVAFVSWNLIEHPAQHWGRRRKPALPRRSGAPSGAVA